MKALPTVYYWFFRSPMGLVGLAGFADRMIWASLGKSKGGLIRELKSVAGDAILQVNKNMFKSGERQLKQYFSGNRTGFRLVLQPQGTLFQRKVWKALQGIAYGQTLSYGAVANKIGNPGAARAVGMACNRNPLWIIIPCHRVVGADGSLVGYGGGLGLKKRLLALEDKKIY